MGGRLRKSAIGLLLCALVVLFVLPAAAQSTGSERRVALVIGNVEYQHVPRLANPGNDATLIATTLRQLGFTLVGAGVQKNIDKAQFDRLVQDFGRVIQGADVALFYYAGHGMQVDGSNWLVPTDANPTRPQDLEFQMVNADLVLKQMDGAGTRLNLVMLDACRNNPFAALGTRAVQGGLAQMRAPEGTMISFATQPGNVAADGSGSDGPYATALADAMRQPGLDIFHVFNRVGLTVKHDTGGAQLPWVSSSPIDGDFSFTQSDAASDAGVTAAIDATPAVPIDQSGGTRTTTNDTPPPGPTATASIAAPPTKPAAENGDAVDRLKSLQDLAEQGKADAQIDLGLAYAKGEGVTRDDATARQWFQRAAAQGVAQAQFLMGSMLERGRGGPRSYDEALIWYQRAAEQSYPPAEAAMGRVYGRGLGVPRDLQQRTEWFRRAADHGNTIGLWALGNFYQSGNGVDKDVQKAVQFYQRAANQGFALAQVRLGFMFENGSGVPKDNAEALRWFRQAADAGNAAGLNNVGTFYRRGLVVPVDYGEAMRLFRQAADKGNVAALYNIGLLYADGQGVPADRTQARAWFQKAADLGNQAAIERLAHGGGGGCNAPPPVPPHHPPGYGPMPPPIRTC
jgi:TPR repeat protein